MKKYYFLFIVVMYAAYGFSQSRPEDFIPRVPSYSTDCEGQSEAYSAKISSLKNDLQAEISRRKSQVKANTKGYDEQAGKNMMKQQGFSVSDADMQKMKSATKEEKMAMANKMLQENQNMSVDEAKNVGKMSKEGQKAWAEGMSTEMMADAQANPGKNQAAQKNNMSMYELIQEQNMLAQKIQAFNGKFSDQMETYEKMRVKASVDYNACEERIRKDFENVINTTLGDSHYEEKVQRHKACWNAFCFPLVSKYKTILDERFEGINKMAKDYYRMDELTNEISKATAGNNKDIVEPGQMFLQELYDYVSDLAIRPQP